MTQQKAKELLSVITHFANDGDLWFYHHRKKDWVKQSAIFEQNQCRTENIIEDKHFESRKAFALGEMIEIRGLSLTYWTNCIHPTFMDECEYRPKPKEPEYEWQWVVKDKEEFYVMTKCYHSKEDAPDHWIKFEPSKRIKNG